MAAKAILDFGILAEVVEDTVEVLPSGSMPAFANGKRKRTNAKAIRNRARRARQADANAALHEEMALLHKPIEEWDMQELARGRPRASDGSFRGRTPTWMTRALHEEAMDRFKDLVRSDMRSATVKALATIEMVLDSEEVDDKGKRIVPASTKLDAAKFLVEQLLGKPKQEVKQDISVKLQGILASAMIMPGQELPAADIELDPEDSWEEDDGG